MQVCRWTTGSTVLFNLDTEAKIKNFLLCSNVKSGHSAHPKYFQRSEMLAVPYSQTDMSPGVSPYLFWCQNPVYLSQLCDPQFHISCIIKIEITVGN